MMKKYLITSFLIMYAILSFTISFAGFQLGDDTRLSYYGDTGDAMMDGLNALGGATYNDDSVVIGAEVFTTDSLNHNDAPALNGGDVLADINGMLDSRAEQLVSAANLEGQTVTVHAEIVNEVSSQDVANLGKEVDAMGHSISHLQHTGQTFTFEAVYQDGKLVTKDGQQIPENLFLIYQYEVDGKIVTITKTEQQLRDNRTDKTKNDYNPDPDNPGEDPTDEPEPHISTPTPTGGNIKASKGITNIPYVHMTATPKAKIWNTEHKYNVEVAIPTSENLTYWASSDNTLYDINTRQHNLRSWFDPAPITGGVIYHWMEGDESCWAGASKTEDFSYSLSKTFYDVNKSDIYNLTGALVQAVQGNYVLEGRPPIKWSGHRSKDTINSYANPGNAATSYYFWIYGPPDGNEMAYCEAALQLVKAGIMGACDRAIGASGSCNYIFTSKNTLHVTKTSHNFTDPGWFTVEDKEEPKMIPENYPNGLYDGRAWVYYEGGHTYTPDCNDVIIHTPVVCYATITSTNFVNQSVNIKSDRTYLQLDGNFTVKIPNGGDYTNWQGYGNRQYNSNQAVPKKNTNWGKIEDIKLPFDVYIFDDNYNTNGKKYFLKHDTWLSESGITGVDFRGSSAGITWRFTVAVWAKEGEYLGNKGIKLRVIAENAASKDASLEQELANTQADHSKYIAIKYIPVEVIGKIYDLQVNESTDKDWTGNVQSLGYSTGYVRANEFPFGRTKSAGVTPAIKPSQNKNTSYQYAPKLGYTFVFNFKTKGRKSNQIDVKVAENGFYFVAKTGGTAIPVDLYYMASNGNYLKITPENNVSKIGVTLTNKFMGVDPIEMNNSNAIYPLENLPKYNYQLRVECGTLAKLLLPHNLRLTYDNFNEYMTDNGGRKLYGNTKAVIVQNAKTAVAHYGFNNAETGEQMVIGSVGHWYAGYALPSSTVAVKQGTDPVTADKAIKTNDSTLTYKTGYILVRFKIKSLNTKAPIVPATPGTTITPGDDYLQYKGPETLNDATGIEYTADEKDKTPGKDFNNPDVVWTIATGMRDITLPSGSPAKVPNDAVAIYETDWKNVVDASGTIQQ